MAATEAGIVGAHERRVRVAVVGAGFSGLSVAWRLLERGETGFLVLERGGRVGGVWRENTYPGAACDVPSHLYSLSFAPNPAWEKSFSQGTQIQHYLEGVAGRRELRERISLNEGLLDASWDDEAHLWRLTTPRGRVEAEVLVACAGSLTEPVYPDVRGLDAFPGKVLHSARWNHGYDLRGQRVAVVGTGASAAQIVPEVQKVAESLVVFQRTPGWVVPRPERRIPEAEKCLLCRFPGLTRVYRLGQYLVRDGMNYRMIRRNPLIRGLFEWRARSFLKKQVEDPELRAKLTPGYEIGCKRVLISNDFYPALASPNVELVASGLREVRGNTLVAADGTAREVDAVVFATGFETTQSPTLARIRGRDGRTIREAWRGLPRFHRATTIAGFPNFFNLGGAGTGTGHGSAVWKAESQTAYVVDALRVMRERDLSSFEPRPDAEARYMSWASEDLDRTVWSRGGCRSWYLDDAGRPSLMWPRTMWGFRRMLRRFDPENYLLRPVQEPEYAPERELSTGGRQR